MNIQDILLKKEKDLKRLKKEKNIPSILENIVEIASYLDFKEDLKWAKFEISGYPDPNDKIKPPEPIAYPSYRRITSYLTIKGPRAGVSERTSGLWLCIPIKVIVKSKIRKNKKIKFFVGGGTQVEFTNFYYQYTKIIDGVKSKIREFYAKITKDIGLPEKAPTNNNLFIKADFKEYQLSQYNDFIYLINSAINDEKFYRILPMLFRTLFENLLYDIFQKGLVKKHTEFFFLESQSRARDFSQLIALLNILKDKNFKPYHRDSINQMIISDLKDIQKLGNWTVHEILRQVDKDFANKWEQKVNRVLLVLLVFYKKIQNEALEITEYDTLEKINKTLNLEKSSDQRHSTIESEGLGRKVVIQKKSNLIEVQNVYNSQKIQLGQKFKNLYNRLASKNPEHVIIDIKTIVEDIGKIDVGKILRMEYVTEKEERIMLIEPQKWNLSIRTGSYRHLILIKYVNGNSKTYDFEFPNQNEDILNNFLELVKERCKEQGLLL